MRSTDLAAVAFTSVAAEFQFMAVGLVVTAAIGVEVMVATGVVADTEGTGEAVTAVIGEADTVETGAADMAATGVVDSYHNLTYLLILGTTQAITITILGSMFLTATI